MNLSTQLSYTIVLVVTTFHLGLGTPVKIDVTTQYQNDLFPNDFNIRCSWETRGNCANIVVLLKVSKEVDKTIATIQGDDSIFYGRMQKSSVAAEGHIDKKQNDRTFLSVTFHNVVKEDSGMYSCIANYMDENGHLKEAKSSWNVTIDDQDLQDVVRNLLVKVTFLENLMKFHRKNEEEAKEEMSSKIDLLENSGRTQSQEIDRVSSKFDVLENSGRTQSQEIDRATSRIDQLEDAGTNRSHMIQGIVDRDAFSSAFSVYGTKDTFSNGETLTFKHFHMNLGNHYNIGTGVFTAPKKGLYAFHLYFLTSKADDMYIHLKVNGVIMTSSFAYDPQIYEQASVSTVLSLNEGDKVWPSASPGGRIHAPNAPYTGFNGNLLQLL